MKKIFTLIAAALCAISSYANDYKDSLVMNVAGVVSEQNATVALTQSADGHYTFSLKNFVLSLGGEAMGVGTITIDNLEAFSAGDNTLLQTSRNITIEAGDIASPSGMWLGPNLGQIPINLTARISNSKVYASIKINMPDLPVDVTFGSGYQLPNSGFETFHKDGSFDAPDSWHSFGTAGGSLAGFVKGNKHTERSDEVRPGSIGSHSVLITATSILGITANGTLTTGRMVAGAFSASDTKNHAEADASKTDKDSHGNSFYATMGGKPDSLAVWVKFVQGTPNTRYPYATISAALTDGTYYQDPEDKTYTNVMAKARNNSIATNGGQWQRIVIPFEYVNKSIDGKVMLITISTNAAPGQGSARDSLFVDDMQLIYNAGLKDSVISDGHVTVTPDGAGAFTRTVYSQKDGHSMATVTVFSDDLKTQTTHVFDLGTATGISRVQDDNAAAEEIFTASGQKVSTMQHGQVYVVKKGSKTYKVVAR